jgi:hypothetical protein
MANKLIDNYFKSLNAIYRHVGFEEDWVVYPIDDCTNKCWDVIGEKGNQTVKYADDIEQYNSDGDYYVDEVYTQRFYRKHIYEGKDFTMIFCNPHVDGIIWFRLFDNKKRMDKDPEINL